MDEWTVLASRIEAWFSERARIGRGLADVAENGHNVDTTEHCPRVHERKRARRESLNYLIRKVPQGVGQAGNAGPPLYVIRLLSC